MDIGWIEDFLALARTCNFSRAAVERNITQPAFSRRIRAVEDWVGTDLIDRSARHFTLTEAGGKFAAEAPGLLLGFEALRRDCIGTGSAISFAATHALASSFVNGWLVAQAPGLGLSDYSLEAADIEACCASVASGRVDFMIVPSVIENGIASFNAANYLRILIGSDALSLVAGGEIARDVERQGLQAALRGRLATYGVSSPFQGLIAGRIKAFGLPENGIISPLVAVLRSMALTGRCAAFLPRSCIERDLASGALVRLDEVAADITYDIGLYRRPTRIGPKAEKLWKQLGQPAKATSLPRLADGIK